MIHKIPPNKSENYGRRLQPKGGSRLINECIYETAPNVFVAGAPHVCCLYVQVQLELIGGIPLSHASAVATKHFEQYNIFRRAGTRNKQRGSIWVRWHIKPCGDERTLIPIHVSIALQATASPELWAQRTTNALALREPSASHLYCYSKPNT